MTCSLGHVQSVLLAEISSQMQGKKKQQPMCIKMYIQRKNLILARWFTVIYSLCIK